MAFVTGTAGSVETVMTLLSHGSKFTSLFGVLGFPEDTLRA